MKRMKRIGVVALVLAGIVLLAGVFSLMLRGNGGLFSGLRESSEAAQAAVQTAAANVKSAQNAAKKADAAAGAAEKAKKEADAAMAAVQEALAARDAHGESGEPLEALYARAADTVAGIADAQTGAADAAIKGALEVAGESAADVAGMAETLLLEALGEHVADASTATAEAVDALEDAQKATAAMYATLGMELPDGAVMEPYTAPDRQGEASLEGIAADAQALVEQAEWLLAQAEPLQAAAKETLPVAEAAQAGVHVGTGDKIVNWLSTMYIFLLFTGILLLVIGVVFTFFHEGFLRQWKKNPVFSTFMALLVMLIVQAYSMKFTYPTVGEWAKFWFDNAFNVLRANTSVGMIALGMTMVVITGGIDLAVGSTLAGVGTVVMVLIDTSANGILQGMGITGMPAYIIGILGGLLTGALIGALIGLGVTKGRVPPFIITLGVMNIVRSLAQYFTKSYTPKVPTEFTVISNTVIFGQRLLPIVYWLVLAVLIYIMMKRTRFGRYVYAVGSNERTTRLSGINVDAVKFKVYALMGILVSIASITQVARLGGMDVASSGSGYELDAIAAVVVGGTSMSGGRGSILGTVIGVLIIGVMNNLLILLGVDSFLTNAFKGAIVVAAVLVQRKEKEA